MNKNSKIYYRIKLLKFITDSKLSSLVEDEISKIVGSHDSNMKEEIAKEILEMIDECTSEEEILKLLPNIPKGKVKLYKKERHSFEEYTPLIDYIEDNLDKIVGQKICGFYSNLPFGTSTDQPVVFELEDYCIVVKYYFYSDMTIYIIEAEQFKKDMTLSFLYKHVPGSFKVKHWVEPMEFPYIGYRIEDIGVNPFSHAFEIDPATGEMMPEGGDYFGRITVYLEDDKEFYICGNSAKYNGYMDVWDWPR